VKCPFGSYAEVGIGSYAVLYVNAVLNLKQKCKELTRNSENDVKRIRYESKMILNNY
jgi:hypothetical protein